MRNLNNKKGVTLVEVMIALVILLLIFIGLTQSALLSIDSNLRNVLRDEAIRIADQRMNGRLDDDSNTRYDGLRIIPFTGTNSLASLSNGAWTPSVNVSRQFRNLTKPYRVCWRITTVDTDPDTGQPIMIRIDVAIGWNHKNENVQQPIGTGNAGSSAEYVHQITTLRRS